MRVGSNPEKGKHIQDKFYHRIIVPIYVPHLNDYFKFGLNFTKLCIESLLKTIHAKSAITVVNNGSCREITTYLQELYTKGKIDQLIHFKSNIGKIDAVISIAKTTSEDLITITDGDVLFKDGWIQEVEKVFVNFPEAGMVSPVPHGTLFMTHTSNTIFDALLKGNLKFQSLCDQEEMLQFANSIGRQSSMYKNKQFLENQLTVSRKGFSAIVGCGHFVSTLRKEVFKHTPNQKSKLAYAASADRDYIDQPVEKAGLWRLATVGNYAYHIGNIPENWIEKKFLKIQSSEKEELKIPNSKRIQIPYFIKHFIVNRLLLNKFVRPVLFDFLGLKKEK